MNRIYQGRVTRVEGPDGKDENGKQIWKPLSDNEWQSALWQHHDLFQDAVNYYIVALLALATNPLNPAYGIREQIASGDGEYQVWLPFRRRGARRRGLRDSVAKYLTPLKPQPTLQECFTAVLAGGSENRPELLDLALWELLAECGGEGAIRQKGREMLPRFCDPKYAAQVCRSLPAFRGCSGQNCRQNGVATATSCARCQQEFEWTT